MHKLTSYKSAERKLNKEKNCHIWSWETQRHKTFFMMSKPFNFNPCKTAREAVLPTLGQKEIGTSVENVLEPHEIQNKFQQQRRGNKISWCKV